MENLFPDVALESLRKRFLFPRSKPKELEALRKALTRIASGELNGTEMAPGEAISYLRGQVEEARTKLAGRDKKYVPHFSTWLNQSRYIVVEAEAPENLEEAISILACYPTISVVDINSHMPVLRIIAEHIRFYSATHGSAAASYIRQRTLRFAECVSRWPAGDFQFIPGADKWFRERRYEQRDEIWERTAKSGFESERAQTLRLVG